MIGIIISAHGTFASGLKSSLDLIIGERKNIKVLDFDGSDVDAYTKNLEKIIEKMQDEYGKVAIVTDIKGGSPFNISAKLIMDKGNVLLFSGANFQLLYELINLDRALEKDIGIAIEKSRREIDYFDISSL